jgi:hypothetical protein
VAITSDFMMNINRQRNSNKTQKRKKEMRQKYCFLTLHKNNTHALPTELRRVLIAKENNCI